jgi:hypothetical protein
LSDRELLERPRRERRAGAAGAVEDHLGVAIRHRVLDALLEEAARDPARPGDVPLHVFVLLADVDDRRPVALLDHLAHLGDVGLGDLTLDFFEV